MNFINNKLNIALNDIVFGYKIQKIIKLNEIDSVFYSLNHIKTGAQHIHIENSDNENTFGVSFKTVPSDSSGIAHVLEHTVLCGSLNFPVRDPFFSMLKRSLSTFMNAFTSSDWTMYPFSTQNKKDYYNLMSVYMDSVFFPKIDEMSFKQEGCRIEFENPSTENALVYRGIVYNEMKGAISSTDQIMIRSLLNILYPDTTYSNNSGGDPIKIPSLTHKKLNDFHKSHYHPSNSYFYTYGDLPLEEHLKYINEHFLSQFTKIHPETNVPNQPRWKQPKKAFYYYPLSKTESTKKKNQVCLAWLTADIQDTFEVLVLSIIEQILLGNDASPLKKTLINSNLGSSLSDGTGFDAENKDTMFVCGLKDVEDSSIKKIETIILDTLNQIVEKGIDQVLIDSVLHQLELNRKEKTNIPYPFGIKLLMGISSCWFHGGNPDNILQINKDLDKIKKYMSSGSFFEKKINYYFIENKHRVLLVLKPDHYMEENENKRLKNELLNIRSNMSPYDIEKIRTDTKKLNSLREKKEDTSCLPTLELKDIPSYVNTIDPPLNLFKNHNVLFYDQPISDILYLSVITSVGSFNHRLLPLIPFFCYAFSRVGTKKNDYTKIAQKIDLYTGGINLSFHPYTIFNSNGVCLPIVSLNTKCLIRNTTETIEIIQEMIKELCFTDNNRILQLLLEYKSSMESMIIRNGHKLAISLASRNYSNSTFLNEMWSGVSQFHKIKDILKKVNKGDIESLTSDLQHISDSIFLKFNTKVALIGENSKIPSIQYDIENFLKSIPSIGNSGFDSINFNLDNKFCFEGWATLTSVSFVAQTFKTVGMEHDDSPALSVISKILRSMYLHKEIREKGGAYAGFAIYDVENGLFSLCSYRDPNISKTINVYDGVNSFLLSKTFNNNDVKEAILQVCSEIYKPDSPSTAAKKALFRQLVGIDDNARQLYKTQLLKLNRKDVLTVAEKYFQRGFVNKSIAIVSNEKLLETANTALDKFKLQIRPI